MFKYILKRIGYMLVTLLIISAVTFFMMHSIPGDPLGATVNKLPEQARENYYAKYGLDKPVTEQYAIFLKNLVTQGDLGESLKYPGQSITHTCSQTPKFLPPPAAWRCCLVSQSVLCWELWRR